MNATLKTIGLLLISVVGGDNVRLCILLLCALIMFAMWLLYKSRNHDQPASSGSEKPSRKSRSRRS